VKEHDVQLTLQVIMQRAAETTVQLFSRCNWMLWWLQQRLFHIFKHDSVSCIALTGNIAVNAETNTAIIAATVVAITTACINTELLGCLGILPYFQSSSPKEGPLSTGDL